MLEVDSAVVEMGGCGWTWVDVAGWRGLRGVPRQSTTRRYREVFILQAGVSGSRLVALFGRGT